jgi:hypothetical protein
MDGHAARMRTMINVHKLWLEIYKARYYWGEMDVYDRTILKNEIT